MYSYIFHIEKRWTSTSIPEINHSYRTNSPYNRKNTRNIRILGRSSFPSFADLCLQLEIMRFSWKFEAKSAGPPGLEGIQFRIVITLVRARLWRRTNILGHGISTSRRLMTRMCRSSNLQILFYGWRDGKDRFQGHFFSSSSPWNFPISAVLAILFLSSLSTFRGVGLVKENSVNKVYHSIMFNGKVAPQKEVYHQFMFEISKDQRN